MMISQHLPVVLLDISLIATKSNTSFEDNSIQRLPGQSVKRKRIVCTECLQNPGIVKRAFYRGRLLPICQPEGTEAREQTNSTTLAEQCAAVMSQSRTIKETFYLCH